MPDELMALAKDQFGPHYLQFEIWVGKVIDASFNIGKAQALAPITAETHVLMPVKANGEMCEAIENYYCNTIRYKDGKRQDEMKAACWGALMAYHAMVKLFTNAAPQAPVTARPGEQPILTTPAVAAPREGSPSNGNPKA